MIEQEQAAVDAYQRAVDEYRRIIGDAFISDDEKNANIGLYEKFCEEARLLNNDYSGELRTKYEEYMSIRTPLLEAVHAAQARLVALGFDVRPMGW